MIASATPFAIPFVIPGVIPGARPAARLAVVVAVALAAGGCTLMNQGPDPALVKATELDGRVGALEKRADSLLDLQRQIDALEKQTRELKGQLEQANHERDTLKSQNRDLYADLEKRTAALETRAAAPVAAVAAAAPGGGDREAYAAALDKLKGRDYAGAEKAFVDMIARYPDSSLADNAKYWLGETYYVEKHYPEALNAFQRVLHEHPDSRKVPDALLKAGYSYYEQKRYKESRDYLTRVLKQYPDSNAATEARERLKHMTAEGH